MKQDSKTRGQDILTVNDEAGFHLPFCGLGAEREVKTRAARCGLGLSSLEPSLHGAAGGAAAPPQH